ncbi:hypothetical protein BJF79_07340 [Actinomadura sp. CNU-125]|uniref:HAD family hydrolase n=1 Tax=Actinomadura sp. CNU-125 TaxID=1904961 RepID=UPI000968476D|nr:HAD family hydrolase [Actinomadura sp. CNU-125]OLT34375.1 hypothetical protein BJF79_07340 [Actinomadura sp. CNU-125]
MPADHNLTFRAAAHGGSLTHAFVDYGRTLTDPADPVDLDLCMRPVTPAARTSMRAAADAGVTLALLSNTGPGQDRRRALQAAGIADLFGDRVYLSHELGISKPDRVVFEYVLTDLGVDPEQALSVGNNIDNDISPAVQLGMRAVFISRWQLGKCFPGMTWISSIAALPVLLTGKPAEPPSTPHPGGGAA